MTSEEFFNERLSGEPLTNGETIYLGVFDTELEAKNAYLESKLKYHTISE